MSGADTRARPAFPHLLWAGKIIRAVASLLWRELAAERERWPLWLPAFLGAGIAVYFALDAEPLRWPGWLALVATIVVAIATRRRPALLLLCLPLVALTLGFDVAAWRADNVSAPRIERRLGPAVIEGRVVEVEQFDKGPRVTLDRIAIDGLAPSETPARVRVRLRASAPPISTGDHVHLRAVLLPPAPPVAPGAFDFQRYAYFAQLGAVGYGLGQVEATPARPNGVLLWITALRQTIAARISAVLGGAVGGIAVALMTGERASIPDDVISAMRDSGLAHLLAISGLHLGLITGALFFGLRALLALIPGIALRYPIKKWSALVAFGGAVFYLFITGATVPTQRACFMTGVVLLAVVLDRTAISMRLVCWAAFIVLVIQPESMLGASFDLSFAAVLALVAAYESLGGRLAQWSSAGAGWRVVARYVLAVGFTSLVSTLATLPFSLYHFDRLAVFGTITNLIAVPATALWVMPWAIVAYALMPLGLEALALQPMGRGIQVVIWSAKTVSSWPGSTAIVPAMPNWGLVLITLGLLWLCIWRRPWRWAGGAGLALGLASIAMVRQPDVIASGDARLLAVRAADGRFMISPSRGTKFDVDVIFRRAGQSDREAWPQEGASADGRLRCDRLGCIYRASGHIVAFARERAALEDDCRRADVVISAVPARHCPSAHTLVDRFRLWREGGHALWLDPGSVRVESVAEWRGERPWSPRKKTARRATRPSTTDGAQPIDRRGNDPDTAPELVPNTSPDR